MNGRMERQAENNMGHTLYDKIWDAHVVGAVDGDTLIYIDLHLLYEVTSAAAFAGLREARRSVRRPELTLAVADHSIPTAGQSYGISGVADIDTRMLLEGHRRNTTDFGIPFFSMGDLRNGIVHVVGPEQGRTLPGMTIVCGDSHTSTHGAFGALAHGIGTSQVEHVLATQTLRQKKAKNLRVRVDGLLPAGVGAKDIALAIISQIGTAGGTGHVVEYVGTTISALSMEQRMTLCNLTIEGGARAGLIAPDETTFQYLKGRPSAPAGADWMEAIAHWKTLVSDPDAVFDREVEIDASNIEPLVTWGTSPEDVIPVTGTVPHPASFATLDKRVAAERSLEYMGLEAGQKITDANIDVVFIGSCTNSRIEDLRSAAEVIRGRHVASGVRALVVPGSGLVRAQAEAEELDQIFIRAGFEWREPGCSMCVAMNGDQLEAGERCASTSNRNFEGRQGVGGRTHLMSPAMASAAAIAGKIVDVRNF